MIVLRRRHFISLLALILALVSIAFVQAWTGPTQSPPNGNVDTPLNVGAIDQVKSAALGLNALAVFGNAIISTTDGYLNFGDTTGTSGYGFRDNAGTMEYKNEGGTWQRPLSASSTFSQIEFADGTTQTTAASTSGGVMEQTIVSCNTSSGTAGTKYCTTPSCPTGYIRSGCSGGGSDPSTSGSGSADSVIPSGTDACRCRFTISNGWSGSGAIGTCYTYCVK